MKIYAIGDVHGCLESLTNMFSAIDRVVQPEDKIVFVGDYIDRGPDSAGVVQLLIDRSKADPSRYVFLKGNHEDMFLGALASAKQHNTDPKNYRYDADIELFMSNGGLQTIRSYQRMVGDDSNVSNYQINGIIPETHMQFYNNLKLMAQFGRYVFVHAGIDPTLSLQDQHENVLIWSRQTVGYKGKYKGGCFVVHGHTPKDKILITENTADIDTGAVFGGVLTCMVIDVNDNSNEHFEYIQTTGYNRHG